MFGRLNMSSTCKSGRNNIKRIINHVGPQLKIQEDGLFVQRRPTFKGKIEINKINYQKNARNKISFNLFPKTSV